MGADTGEAWLDWSAPAPPPGPLPLPDLTHLLGWRLLSKLEAELSLDLRPGVVVPAFGVEDEDEDWVLLELGVEVTIGPALVPGVLLEVPGEVSSLVAPVDFLLDFLLETLFLFSISDNLMLWWGVS